VCPSPVVVLCAVPLANLSDGVVCPSTVRSSPARAGRGVKKLARLSQICFGDVRGGVLLGPPDGPGIP